MAEGPAKYSIPGKNVYERQSGISLLDIGKVESNTDSADGRRIKVRIKGIDDHIGNVNELPYAFPILPKFFTTVPKVGETVIVFKFDSNNSYENRMYMGPIISQPQKLDKDDHFFGSKSLLDTGFKEPDQSPSNIPEAKGVYPNIEDVAIQGRGNSDIIQKDKEVLIRAGKFVEGDRLTFNENNPGYVQIKHNFNKGDEDNEDRVNIANIVSDKINLISHKGEHEYNVSDPEGMIPDKDMKKILDKASPMVFGDKLKEFLQLMQSYTVSHIHPYHGKEADRTELVNKIAEYNIDDMLSDNIRLK